MEAAVERFRLKRADVLVASDRKTSSSPRAQSQVVPAGTSHPRFLWHANMQLPRERDKSSRAASSKTAEQNCRLHCRQNRRRPAPCRPPGPPLGQWGVCPIVRGILFYAVYAVYFCLCCLCNMLARHWFPPKTPHTTCNAVGTHQGVAGLAPRPFTLGEESGSRARGAACAH